jgi:hypothetical protein
MNQKQPSGTFHETSSARWIGVNCTLARQSVQVDTTGFIPANPKVAVSPWANYWNL